MISPVQAQIFHKYVEEKDLQTFRFYPDRYVLDIWAKMTIKIPLAVRDIIAEGWNNLEIDEALCQLAREHIENGGCVNCKISGDRILVQDTDRNRDSFSNSSYTERASASKGRGVSRGPRAKSKAGPERQGHHTEVVK